jgi:hypothetical protein
MGRFSLLGKWFTMTSKDEDGNIYQNVIYCAEIMENGLCRFIPVNPDPSLDWKKLSCVDAVHFDMAPINNFIYRYFNTLLEKMTFKSMRYPKLMRNALFSTCFDMVTDENMYGNDSLSILEYVTTEAFQRIQKEKSYTEEIKDAYCAVHENMIHDLSRYLSFYEELNGITDCCDNPVKEEGYKSYLNRREWADEKYWCFSYLAV